MNENETYNTDDAIQAVIEIAEIEHINNESLACIESSLEDINNHIADIDEYIVITNKEAEKKDEQKAEKAEKQDEQKAEKGDTETREEEVTISDIHSEIKAVNDNLTGTNTLLTTALFAQGIIIGVLVMILFWEKFLK